jgi:hypothetical protein
MYLDLDDQFRSVFRMLWTLLSQERTAGLRVEDQRSFKLIRPMMRLEQTISREVDRGNYMKEDQVQYAITYYGTSRADCAKIISLINSYVEFGGEDYENRYLIQAWKFGWNFPAPVSIELRAGGTVPNGDHTVRISGVDVCGNESAASLSQTVTMGTGNNSFNIVIPRVPWVHPLFPSYFVYVDGHQEISTLMPKWNYPAAEINGLSGTGHPPLEATTIQGDQNAVRWKFLRVTSLGNVIREDTVENGAFQSTMTLETSMIQARILPQVPIMENLGLDIVITEEV